MFKRILTSLLVALLVLGLSASVLAANAPISQTVTAQNGGVTVQLNTPGGKDSASGRVVYTFPEELTLMEVKPLIAEEGIDDLRQTKTSLSFAWACYEDFATETALMRLVFTGKPGSYSVKLEMPEIGYSETQELRITALYKDVQDPSVWYYTPVYAATAAGLMNGVGDDLFAPGGSLTRGAMATLLYRMSGEPKVTGKVPFTDVAEGRYYTNAILWAAQNKLVNGYGNGLFGPEHHVTREQTATMLVRYAQFRGVELPKIQKAQQFTDQANISNFAKEAVTLCSEAGLIHGYPDGTFLPKNAVTRAEAAKMIVGFYSVIEGTQEPALPTEPTDPITPPTDPVPPTDPTKPVEEGYTVTFQGEQGYAKVDGQKVSSVTLDAGQDYLAFSLYGDKSIGREVDAVNASAGKLVHSGDAYILKNIDRDITISYTTKHMMLTVNFTSVAVATIEPATVQVPWGETVSEPTATRTGYTVSGWYLEKGLVNRFDLSSPVYEDMTLYAKWDPMLFTVNFYDGDVLLSTQKVQYNKAIDRPANPVKEDYLFSGWYTDPELTNAFDFSKRCTSDMNLYAKWRVDDRAEYIYLGGNVANRNNEGICGDDANDGSSEEKAVRTFERAKELLKDAKNPVIVICGTVTVDQTTTWSMSDLEDGKVLRANLFKGRMVRIESPDPENPTTLTLDHIIVDGGATMWPEMLDQTSVWYLFNVGAGANLVLNEGAVLQNACASASMTGGAVYVEASNDIIGSFTMNEGSKVINNYGGMTAGICGTGGAKITINGGEISGNIARYASASLPHRGSAISVSSGSTNYPAVLTINGGTITNNSSITGCAVSLNQHAAGYLNGGTITGNVSTSDYGGIVANGDSGSATWFLNGGTVTGNVSDPAYGDDQVIVLKKAQVILGAEKDALTIGGIFMDTQNLCSAIGVSKPIANVNGGKIQVTLNYLGIDTILATGYNTYKLTQEDVAAYQLTNALDPYYKAELDLENNRYEVLSNQKIGAVVYLSDPTNKNHPGNDENDGLTQDTPVATFARAKEILKANAKEEGDNIISIMYGVTVAAGTSETWSLAGIPNAMIVRDINVSSGHGVYVYGELTLEDIVIDGNCLYSALSKNGNAFARVDKGGKLTVKKGTKLQNFRTSSSAFVYAFAAANITNTITVEDVTVTGIQSYTMTNSETAGAFVFGLYGGGSNILTVKNGTFTGNEARLLYVTGAGAHVVNVDDCNFSNNTCKGCGGVFLLSNTSATSAVVNVNGGTYTNNRCTNTAMSYANGTIGYVKSPATLNINGGTFTGNTSAAGEIYSGLTIRGFNKTLSSHIHLNNLTGDVFAYVYPYSKTVNNDYFVIEKALSHTVHLTDRYNYADYIVAAGTDTYALTQADLAKFVSTDPAVQLYLDTQTNTIRIQAPAT